MLRFLSAFSFLFTETTQNDVLPIPNVSERIFITSICYSNILKKTKTPRNDLAVLIH